MLQIKNISKQYKTGDLVQNALNDVSLNFRDNEFVSILGPSGSGKTTLLNIIGGLDKYTSGDLIISELSTKDKIINKLQAGKEKLKTELQKFKGFWHKLIKHFQNKIGFDKDENYKYVSDDLYKNGIFDDNDNRIVNDVSRAIKTVDELNNTNIKKKNNMELK